MKFFKGIEKKRVLITGASGGIGSAMAELFAAHGAVVGLHYGRNKAAADRLRQKIVKQGGRAECFKADLLELSAPANLIESFLARFGRLDVLINNAGAVINPCRFLELDEDAWDQTFALNVKSAFFLSQKAFVHMKDRGGGKIINISSIAARYGGFPVSMHYGAAKAALEAVTLGLARAGAPERILVNAIQAGFIQTTFHQKMGRQSFKKRIGMIPLKRPGRPIDVARMALYLASVAGDFITGQTMVVSGGD